MTDPRHSPVLWYRNPWFLSAIGGALLLTLTRDCTRYEPSPPPVVSVLDATLLDAADELAPMDPGLLLLQPCSGAVGLPEAEMKRLREGIRLWNLDLPTFFFALEGFGNGLDEWIPGKYTPERCEKLWDSIPKGDDLARNQGLLLLLSRGFKIRSITGVSRDGFIETFHKANLLILEKKANGL